jgi:hypothetical protein
MGLLKTTVAGPIPGEIIPMMTRGVPTCPVPTWVDGGGEHDAATRTTEARRPSVLLCMLFYPNEDEFNGSE